MTVADLRNRGGTTRIILGRLGADEPRIGYTELCRVLVLTGALDDDLDAVVRHIGCERGRRGPDELSAVRDVVHNTTNWQHIGGWTT